MQHVADFVLLQTESDLHSRVTLSTLKNLWYLSIFQCKILGHDNEDSPSEGAQALVRTISRHRDRGGSARRHWRGHSLSLKRTLLSLTWRIQKTWRASKTLCSMLALKRLRGLVIIDEIQRLPGLFPALRVLADRPRLPARFLILGSASPELLRQGSESLAGRIYYYELPGFALEEVGPESAERLWLRGGFPRAYLERTLKGSEEWRQGFIRTFLERDLPQLGIRIDARSLRRFWTMLAHYHGQIWNAAEFGRSFGVSDTTVRRYLDTLTAALVVGQLPPWHANVKKRQM